MIISTISLSIISYSYCNAQTKTANTGDWNRANTWTPSGVPGDNDIILIPAGETVSVRGTDHTLNDAILIVEGDLVMESKDFFGIPLADYGSLTFLGDESGVIIEDGGQVTDGTSYGGDTHFISVQDETVWSGDDCNSNCGTIEGNYTSSGESTAMPASLINPLPVEMLYFSGSYKNEAVKLLWATASEINNSRFEVERATSDFEFKKIGEVHGAGYSTQQIEYNFEDKALVNDNMLYYRLKQIDYDGGYEYSNIIAVYNEMPIILEIWPTPFVNNVTISLDGPSSGSAYVKLFDIKGRERFSQSYDIIKGVNTLEVDGLEELHSGIYFLDLTSNSFHHRKKIIKH